MSKRSSHVMLAARVQLAVSTILFLGDVAFVVIWPSIEAQLSWG